MHRATKRMCELPESANRSIARRAQLLRSTPRGHQVGLDKQCLLIEVRLQESCLPSGGRHRRGVAQQQVLLRGQDERRVHTPHPPKLRRRPLLDRLLYGRRLDHQSAGLNKLAQLPLLLEGRLELERLHPVEGGPNGAPLVAALLLDELPELSPAASAQGLFLRSHEQPSLPL